MINMIQTGENGGYYTNMCSEIYPLESMAPLGWLYLISHLLKMTECSYWLVDVVTFVATVGVDVANTVLMSIVSVVNQVSNCLVLAEMVSRMSPDC